MVEQKAVAIIRGPKLVPPCGISFTKNKKFMALAERREGKDWISIYYTGNDWKLINTFEVETLDLQDIMWVKEDTSILVYDSYLEAKIFIYSAMTGTPIAKHIFSVSGLGVKSVSVSPNGVFIIASFFDNKLKVFNSYTSKEITSLEHSSQINL